MFEWLRKKKDSMILQRMTDEIEELKSQLSDYRQLASQCLLPVEQLAMLSETNLSDLKLWVSFGKLFSKEIGGNLYIPGEVALRLLSDKDGSLHLMSRYKKPLIPSDAIRASASIHSE